MIYKVLYSEKGSILPYRIPPFSIAQEINVTFGDVSHMP